MAITSEVVELTVRLATQLAEDNPCNRPFNHQHHQMICAQLRSGSFKTNGDAIRIDKNGNLLDGQHRIWAVIETGISAGLVIIVRGLDPDVITTIDTLRRPRSHADTIALAGVKRHRNIVAGALAWLIRWQRGVLLAYRSPEHKITNFDIDAALAANPNICRAVDVSARLRRVYNPGVLGMVYYVASNRNQTLADEMIGVLENPSGTGIAHPFYLLRSWMVMTDRLQKRDPLVAIALSFKALTAVHTKQQIRKLSWRNQGEKAEDFPVLRI